MTWSTHEITNQFDEWSDYDPLETDAAARAALREAGAGWAEASLGAYGRWLMQADTRALAAAANACTPAHRPFDARGRRVDVVEFHGAWHALLGRLRAEGLVSMPFADARTGRWTAWAVGFYLHGQAEAGTLCPATMTQASIPLLQREPALWARVGAKLVDHRHDPRDLPLEHKTSMWIGMGMTEKQGGSDVRSNTTEATPVGAGGRGGEYRLRGHKWFFSAPTSDAHLVVARAGEDGHSCFYVPRFLPDGSRNAIRIQRLKDKIGNRSNASSEVEFEDATGVLIGEAGKGIRTIVEMATYTRLNCVLGSAAILRQGLVQALAYARRRRAFGAVLAGQPLMRAVLVDLALESEAAFALAIRLAEAFEKGADPRHAAWKRIMTPAAKYLVCKRTVEMTGETIEVFGGNGYVDEGAMARLYREAPVNSIWEGSGNVMCLDVLRAIQREPQALQEVLAELDAHAGDDRVLKARLAGVRDMLATPPAHLEALARRFVGRLATLAQACLLRHHAARGAGSADHGAAAVADGFVATRFAGDDARTVGGIDLRMLDADAILARALPD
ncbi:MAG: acyl-CoA dehydrogenase family protein [Lautropia sp.]